MDKDKVKGAMDDVAGRIKRQTGEWTGDPNKQVEGAAQQIKGKAEKALGNMKDAARDANAKAHDANAHDKQHEEQHDTRRTGTHN